MPNVKKNLKSHVFRMKAGVAQWLALLSLISRNHGLNLAYSLCAWRLRVHPVLGWGSLGYTCEWGEGVFVMWWHSIEVFRHLLL